jgi:hypothetical protein
MLKVACLAVMLLPIAGCGNQGPSMGTVTGKISYTDGSNPTGGIAVIRFEVASDSSTELRKAASADIEPDGSYELMTIRPGDGAFYGDYDVVFTIQQSYRNAKQLVAEKYTLAGSSPFQRTIDSPSNVFDFEIEKAP